MVKLRIWKMQKTRLTATVKTTVGKMVSVPVTKENYIGVKEYERITDNYF